VLALTAGLGTLAVYVWFSPATVRFDPEQLKLAATVGAGRPEGPVLHVSMSNHGRYALMIRESPELGAPFELRVTSEAGGVPLKRLASQAGRPAAFPYKLRGKGQRSWSVPLSRLYGRLPAGRYRLELAYDTDAAAERGEGWAEELDLGRVEAQPVIFEIKPETRPGK